MPKGVYSSDKRVGFTGKNAVDLTGMRFGKLTAQKRIGSDSHGTTIWELKCDCGNIVHKKGLTCFLLENHKTKEKNLNCGCWKGKWNQCSNPEPIFIRWEFMRSRSTQKKNQKNVPMCEDWNDFFKFRDWGLANGYSDGSFLARKDNNGINSPENCFWLTKEEYKLHRSKKYVIELDGQKKTLSEWSLIGGVKSDTIIQRINRGWNSEDAIFTDNHVKNGPDHV